VGGGGQKQKKTREEEGQKKRIKSYVKNPFLDFFDYMKKALPPLKNHLKGYEFYVLPPLFWWRQAVLVTWKEDSTTRHYPVARKPMKTKGRRRVVGCVEWPLFFCEDEQSRQRRA